MVKKNKKEVTTGLRRSRRLQGLPPAPLPSEGGSTTGTGRREPPVGIGQGDGDADPKVGETTAGGGMSGVGSSSGNSQEVGVEEVEPHPCVFNEDILYLVFKQIITQSEVMQKDIQNARLVCQPWRNSATRVYRQSRPVKIFVQPKETLSLYERRLWKKTLTLSDFMTTMTASDMIPIQKYKLDQTVFTNSDPELIKNFFRICGPEVVSLDMSIMPKDAGRIMKNLKTMTPPWKMNKLKTLTFQTFDDQPGPEGIVDLIGFIFNAGETLREFDLSYLPSGQVTNLQEALSQLLATRIPATVKDLKLYMELNEPTFNNLAGSGLKLDGFELRVPSELESGTLYKFLEGQAATLKSLRIWSPLGAQSGIAVKFPRLGQLVHLEVSDLTASFDTNSDFAKSFPKLRYLEISRMATEAALRGLLPGTKTTAAHSVKVLHMPEWHRSLTPIVGMIGKAFPALAELHIRLYNGTRGTLEEVFTHLDNIESLHITVAETGTTHNADSLLSGISEPDCSQIGRLQDFGNVNLVELERRPSLLNLTNLKKLVVKKVCTCDVTPLTDFCAHFVLLEMMDLREVQFGSGIALLSPRYLELLRDQLVHRMRGQ